MRELTPVVRASVLALARDPSEARFAALVDPSAVVQINLRTASSGDLLALLGGLDVAQRASLTAVGDDGRTVLIAPARTGRPQTRSLMTFSHPGGTVTEIVAYSDAATPGPAEVGATSLPGSRALPGASPHKAVSSYGVLVTASTDALGLAIGTAFVSAGASVVFHGRRADFEPPAAAEHATVAYVSADLSEPDGADRLAVQAAAALGRPITVLVNNLGPWDGTPVSEVAPAAWQQALQSGFTSQLRLAQLVAPGMREAGRGRIVNITTVSTSKRNHGTYSFVKAGLAFLTEALAIELAPEITVNSVAPGQIEESVPLMNSLNPTAARAMLELTPLGRFVTRTEIADAVVSIAMSPPFDTMTGASLPLGGGYQLAFDGGA
jgi:NAD(P)-dependent dehydrogenase (short-subunit alcohol dehydrogenase family)